MIWRVERRTIITVPRVDRRIVSALVARKNNAAIATKAEGGTETEGVGLSHRSQGERWLLGTRDASAENR